MKFKDYSELALYVEEHDDSVEYILGCDDWSVVKIDNKYWYYEHPVEDASDVFYEVVPSTDVVEVVFCEKCKYCKKDKHWKELYCLKMSDDEHTHWVKKDFYCGYGERRADE